MARIENHGDANWSHAVFCTECDRYHGPLFICDSYDVETKLDLELAQIRYRRAAREGKLGLMGVFFPG